MKIIFYGADGDAAKACAKEMRAKKQSVRVLHAEACREGEPCDGIAFMSDVSDYDRKRLSGLFKKGEAKQEGDGFTIGLGPRGKIYILNGKDIHSGPFDTKSEAEAALAKERGEPDEKAELAALRAEYERTVGKKPFGGWKADELRKRIAEASA